MRAFLRGTLSPSKREWKLEWYISTFVLQEHVYLKLEVHCTSLLCHFWRDHILKTSGQFSFVVFEKMVLVLLSPYHRLGRSVRICALPKVLS